MGNISGSRVEKVSRERDRNPDNDPGTEPPKRDVPDNAAVSLFVRTPLLESIEAADKPGLHGQTAKREVRPKRSATPTNARFG